jgi:ATP-dependent Lon protease
MNEDIKDAAYSFAKRRGDVTVDVGHVLYIVTQKYAQKLQAEGIESQQVLVYLGAEGDSIKPPVSFSDAAIDALKQLNGIEEIIAWAVTTYRNLVLRSGKSSPSQSGVATNTEASSTKPHVAPSENKKRTVEEIFAEIDTLVGLHKVKSLIRDVVARQKAAAVMQERGQEVVFSKHLVFTGSPGTGKTTVARYIGELYAAINVLPGDSFVEVGRADLIAEYVGQTATKVRAVVERARGGVLFIDEAYALMPHHAHDYGHEALSTLVQLMENYRDDLVVVMAGYRHEMQAMIDSNPGLRSRMSTYIDFPNYTPDELCIIFQDIVKSHSVTVEPEAVTYLHSELDTVVSHIGFGNARFVRSVWEHAFSHMATREFGDGAFDDNELRTLQVEDVKAACGELIQGLRQRSPQYTKRVEITRPGIVTGLAWTAYGGDILYLEAALFPGKHDLHMTGQLGDVMSESVKAALSCVLNYASSLGISPKLFDESSIHIHAPDGAIPKDGPSAGIAVATAIASAATQRAIRNDVAMTGEVTIYGRVMKVGGIREKIMAAHRAGITTVVIPGENMSDVDEVPTHIRTAIHVIPVYTIEEVLQHALLPK